MERREFIDKFCILKPDFTDKLRHEIHKTQPNAKIKDGRPHLVIELLYKGQPQLFAIPTQTSVKTSLGQEFCHKLPARLETKSGTQHALLYSSMVPISANAILCLKGADTAIPTDEVKREVLYHSINNKKVDALPESAQKSFAFMKREVMHKGIGAYASMPFQRAYAVVAHALNDEKLRYKDAHLAEIKKQAQTYLTQHYEATLATRQHGEYRMFVDMPDHYTNIQELVKIAEKYNASHNSSQIPLLDMHAEPLKPLPSGGNRFGAKLPNKNKKE